MAEVLATPPAQSQNKPAEGAGAPPAGGGAPGSQAQIPQWLAPLKIPDEVKKAGSLTRYKTVEDALTGHVELDKKFGAAKRVPAADAEQGEWDKFFNDLGRPESPEKYALEIPEGVPVDENFVKGAKAAAHALGMNQKQFEAFGSFYVGEIKAALEKSAEVARGWDTEIETEWGHAAERNTAIAERAAMQFGERGEHKIEGLADFLDLPVLGGGKVGNHPAMMRLFKFLGEAMGEGAYVKGETRANPGEIADAQAELKAIRNDPAHKYFTALHDQNHPQHKAAVEYLTELSQAAYGQES